MKKKKKTTVRQMLKWRRDILLGKSKYYPKELLGKVAGMAQIVKIKS